MDKVTVDHVNGGKGMKKRFFVMVGVLIILTTLLSGCMTSSYSGVNVSSAFLPDHWSISASSINGYFSKTVNFSADQMAALQVKNTNSDGTVTLTLAQGSTVKTFDVSGTYEGNIDMSAFTTGKISMRLDFGSAKEVKTTMSWSPR